MVQYQTFPDAHGGSRTLDKLKALRLPPMAGLSFLDIGCNEGFFCGYAKFDGAARSVGIDHSAEFISRAEQRFPDCEFYQQSWDKLPGGPFDVILLASALHYAPDQPALLERLVNHLTPDGTLVLELGVAREKTNEWVRVKRSIDERYFPTWDKLKEVLAGYAWKYKGPSVQQGGDPLPRHVIHISRRKPVAYLLTQPPAYGKSTIARFLFPPAGVTVVGGDQLLADVASKKIAAGSAVHRTVARNFSAMNITDSIRRIFEGGLAEEFLDLWLQRAGQGDFAYDGFIPPAYQQEVIQILRRRGYLPVTLEWEREGPAPYTDDKIATAADSFFRELGRRRKPVLNSLPSGRLTGFVDNIELDGDLASFRGWAINGSGKLPTLLKVQIGSDTYMIEDFEQVSRPDVKAHFGLKHDLVGYRFQMRLKRPMLLREVAGTVRVFGGETPEAVQGPFSLSKKLQSWL